MSKKRRNLFFLLLLLLLNFISPSSGSASMIPSLILKNPGDDSLVASPIIISAELCVQENFLVRVSLTDRSGTVIARKLLRLDTSGNTFSNLSTDLLFEIPGDASEGLLSISLLDVYGRPVALRSASITLLSSGEPRIESPSQNSDWLTITQPQPGEDLSGGEVHVTGMVTPLVERPVFFELITDSGGQIGTKQLQVISTEEAFSFDVSIPYGFITERRDVRLVIRQNETKFEENIILDSVLIFLSP
jgi:hypothetical protein